MAANKDNLQRLLHPFQTKAESPNMQISMEKKESMVASKEHIKCKLAVNDKPIHQCMLCTYLGIEITSFKSLQQEVRAQINKVLRTSGYLRDQIWRNKYTSAESKVPIYTKQP
ncbi:hypothetical protein Trydic_g12445 [Trypoxylus dichotomus]